MTRILLISLFAMGCTEHIEGVSIDLVLHVEPLDASAHDNMGRSISAAKVTVSAAEIFECPSMGRRIINALAPISTAWAHGTESPTHLATPHVVDLVHDSEIAFGRFEPPPGDYCSVRISLGPADDDAEGVTGEIVGHTLLLQSPQLPQPHLNDGVTFVDLLLDHVTVSETSPHAQVDVWLTPGVWLSYVDADAADLSHANMLVVTRTP